jgi:leader peptidase (prepilin peptidase)/N-methyltransferase
LKAWDLVPVLSYLFLGARCRYCRDKISPLYPIVEILTAVSFFLIYLEWGITLQAAIGFIFTIILIITAFTDINEGIIPDLITYPGIVIGLFLSLFSIGFKSSALGAIVFATIFLVTAIVSRGGMGGGDIKLAGVIGAFTGFTGAVQTLIISSVAGGIWALLLIILGKADRKTSIRFGPFLAVSAWLVWLYGGDILDIYLKYFV